MSDLPTLQEILEMPVREAHNRCGYAYRELRRRLIEETDEHERRQLVLDVEEFGRRWRALEAATQ